MHGPNMLVRYYKLYYYCSSYVTYTCSDNEFQLFKAFMTFFLQIGLRDQAKFPGFNFTWKSVPITYRHASQAQILHIPETYTYVGYVPVCCARYYFMTFYSDPFCQKRVDSLRCEIYVLDSVESLSCHSLFRIAVEHCQMLPNYAKHHRIIISLPNKPFYIDLL